MSPHLQGGLCLPLLAGRGHHGEEVGLHGLRHPRCLSMCGSTPEVSLPRPLQNRCLPSFPASPVTPGHPHLTHLRWHLSPPSSQVETGEQVERLAVSSGRWDGGQVGPLVCLEGGPGDLLGQVITLHLAVPQHLHLAPSPDTRCMVRMELSTTSSGEGGERYPGVGMWGPPPPWPWPPPPPPPWRRRRSPGAPSTSAPG